MVSLRYRREHPDAAVDELDKVVRHWWGGRSNEATLDGAGCLRIRHGA